jgi:hypothetical protein
LRGNRADQPLEALGLLVGVLETVGLLETLGVFEALGLLVGVLVELVAGARADAVELVVAVVVGEAVGDEVGDVVVVGDGPLALTLGSGEAAAVGLGVSPVGVAGASGAGAVVTLWASPTGARLVVAARISPAVHRSCGPIGRYACLGSHRYARTPTTPTTAATSAALATGRPPSDRHAPTSRRARRPPVYAMPSAGSERATNWTALRIMRSVWWSRQAAPTPWRCVKNESQAVATIRGAATAIVER